MYVIKNGDYYLSNYYEKAAELVLGYGYVFSKENIMKFKTKTEAIKFRNKLKRLCGYKNLEVIDLNVNKKFENLEKNCMKLRENWKKNPTADNWNKYRNAYNKLLNMLVDMSE